jgi:hypothetical protein
LVALDPQPDGAGRDWKFVARQHRLRPPMMQL